MTIQALPLALLLPALASQAAPPAPPEVELVQSHGWGDYDADGLADVYVMRSDGPDRLYRNLGDGRLEDVTEGAGLAPLARSRFVLWRDVDGDGALDLYLGARDGGGRLLRNLGGTFQDVTDTSGLATAGEVQRAARFLDYDGDGRVDLYVVSDGGARLYRNAGGASFEPAELPVPAVADPPAETGVVMPADAEGDESGRPAPSPSERGRGGRPAPAGRPGPGTRVPGGGGASAGLGSGAGVNAAAANGSQAAGGLDQLCADSMEDLATASCLTASSVGMLGSLYPLSVDFNVDGAGRVGIGTASPSTRLHVAGEGRFDGRIGLADPLGSPANVQLDMTGGYSMYRDDLGAGADATRLWFNAPDEGEMVFGPRGGADYLGNLRLRSDTMTFETTSGGANTMRVEGPNVGINTAAPTSRLHVEGTAGDVAVYGHAPFQAANQAIGVEGVGEGSSSVGVHGVSTNTSGPGYGVWAECNSTSGRAVFAQNHATTGTNMAVYAEASATNGRGVYGNASATTGTNYGVYGASSSTSGRGVLGTATATSGSAYGVYGRTNSLSGAGVYGLVDATTGGGFGVLGETRGNSNGAAVQASSLFSSGISDGLRAQTDSSSGWAVWGTANTAGGRGVVGQAPSGSSALHANGDLNVTGTKNFVQAHPTDPSKEIRFVCLEGNESGTYFRGTGRVVGGECVIEVPEEFRLVTAEAGMTVQLTARGPAHLWYERAGLDEVLVRGSADCEFDYFVNGVRRGFEEIETVRANSSFKPRFRGVPFGSDLPPAARQVLVENGILNPDFTPDEATAAALGWTLHDAPEPARIPEVREGSAGHAAGQ